MSEIYIKKQLYDIPTGNKLMPKTTLDQIVDLYNFKVDTSISYDINNIAMVWGRNNVFSDDFNDGVCIFGDRNEIHSSSNSSLILGKNNKVNQIADGSIINGQANSFGTMGDSIDSSIIFGNSNREKNSTTQVDSSIVGGYGNEVKGLMQSAMFGSSNTITGTVANSLVVGKNNTVSDLNCGIVCGLGCVDTPGAYLLVGNAGKNAFVVDNHGNGTFQNKVIINSEEETYAENELIPMKVINELFTYDESTKTLTINIPNKEGT